MKNLKGGIAILLVMLLCWHAQASVDKATSVEDVQQFLERNQDNTVALFFVDSSLTDEAAGGFWSGVISSVSHIFSGDADAGSAADSVAAIEKDVAAGAAMLQIDVNDESLRDVQESYDVTTVPFLIVFKRGIVVLKEVPTSETHDKILQVLNVNPVAVHSEAAAAPPAPEPVAAEPTPAPVAVKPTPEPVAAEPTPAPVAAEPTPEPIEHQPHADDLVYEQPIILEPSNDSEVDLIENQGEWEQPDTYDEEFEPIPEEAPPAYPIDETPKHITLAPGEVERPRPQPEPSAAVIVRAPEPAPKEEPKPVQHKCRDVTTYDEPANWRCSPYYIKELEDYELPEEWWRNGYKPIKDSSGPAAEKDTCGVVPPPPEVVIEPIVIPSPVFVEPVVIPYVHPHPVVEPVVHQPVRPAVHPTYVSAPHQQRYVQRGYETVGVHPTVVTNTTTVRPANATAAYTVRGGPVGVPHQVAYNGVRGFTGAVRAGPAHVETLRGYPSVTVGRNSTTSTTASTRPTASTAARNTTTTATSRPAAPTSTRPTSAPTAAKPVSGTTSTRSTTTRPTATTTRPAGTTATRPASVTAGARQVTARPTGARAPTTAT